MTQFATPGSPSGGLDLNTLNGSLLLVKVIAAEDHIPNVFTEPGEKSPAVRADVTVLDGASQGEEHKEALIWPRVLQGQLRSRVGELVLGRLAQGEKKPGQNAPWILQPASEADVKTAQAWLENQTRPSVSSAEPPF